MISIYQLKQNFQNLLRPLSNALAKRGVTANQITLSAIALSVFYGLILCLNIKLIWALLPFVLFIRMGLNALDGMLAREHNMKSKLGMALNELGDVVSDTALFIPFLFFAPQASWMIGFFIIMAIMTELCGLTAFMMSGERRYDGPMGKSDRAFVTGTLGFLMGLGLLNSTYLIWIFALMSALACWCCINRIRAGIRI